MCECISLCVLWMFVCRWKDTKECLLRKRLVGAMSIETIGARVPGRGEGIHSVPHTMLEGRLGTLSSKHCSNSFTKEKTVTQRIYMICKSSIASPEKGWNSRCTLL